MILSTANGQRCLYCGATFQLYPPIVSGCPACATDTFRSPLELTYAYPETGDWLPPVPLPGLERYAVVLPPLSNGLSMGEGGTPLVRVRVDDSMHAIWIKDETRNPTWSHKDRLNLCVVSAALQQDAVGLVAASSCNHGASAAAYAARAGLNAVILTTPRPAAIAAFLGAYGQLVVAVPTSELRWVLMTKLIDELGFAPASNQTSPPTNHPFGSEGYKTIAYELFLQLERQAPEAVFVPVGYAELLFGIYKGFLELKQYGMIEKLPRMIACEPAAAGPLNLAIKRNLKVITVEPQESCAYSIAVPTNSYRGVVAVKQSEGAAIVVSETEIRQAQVVLARFGMWPELSSAVAFAGAMHAHGLGLGKGPLVSINTSSGFKDFDLDRARLPVIDGSWDALITEMKKFGF